VHVKRLKACELLNPRIVVPQMREQGPTHGGNEKLKDYRTRSRAFPHPSLHRHQQNANTTTTTTTTTTAPSHNRAVPAAPVSPHPPAASAPPQQRRQPGPRLSVFRPPPPPPPSWGQHTVVGCARTLRRLVAGGGQAQAHARERGRESEWDTRKGTPKASSSRLSGL